MVDVQAMGHEEVAVLDGGLPEWGKQGMKMEPIVEEAYEMGNFEANPSLDLKKEMTDILSNLETGESLILDARSGGRFDGTAPEPVQALSIGHIPQSKSLPFSQVLVRWQIQIERSLSCTLCRTQYRGSTVDLFLWIWPNGLYHLLSSRTSHRYSEVGL